MNAESVIVPEIEVVAAPQARVKRLRRILMLAGPAMVLLAALYLYLASGRYESTDNAALQTGMVAISPGVSGKVVSIEVHENQRVRKGDVLFRIGPDSYQSAVAEAQAGLTEARAEVSSLQAEYREAVSDLAASRARFDFARDEASRQRSLVAEGIASRSQFDEAVMAAKTAKEAIAAARAKADSLRERLGGNVNGAVDRQPAVLSAASRLDQAIIRLNDTVVRAPQDGVVTRVNQLQVGSYVTSGRPVFMLTGLQYWVQANFKEDQLRHMRIGQPVKVKIDAFPDHPLNGRVESFSPGTGSSFSILPPENATGNWVKVVQRLPVQVAIDSIPKGLPLGAGMSVEVEVDTGHVRHLFGPDTVNPAHAAEMPKN